MQDSCSFGSLGIAQHSLCRFFPLSQGSPNNGLGTTSGPLQDLIQLKILDIFTHFSVYAWPRLYANVPFLSILNCNPPITTEIKIKPIHSLTCLSLMYKAGFVLFFSPRENL